MDVRRVQDLRRSNAAQPIPAKRRDDYDWEDDWDDYNAATEEPCYHGGGQSGHCERADLGGDRCARVCRAAEVRRSGA